MRLRTPVAVVLLLLAGACVPKRGARFQHVTHAGRGLDCLACHGEIGRDGAERAELLPLPAQCSSCHPKPHGGKEYTGACGSCHVVEVASGEGVSRLVFSHPKHLGRNRGQCFPCHNEVTVKAHGDDRPVPKMETCLRCHQPQFDRMECTYCHENLNVFPIRPVSQFAHQGDFLRIHGRIGRSRPELCAQCHTVPFCTACHDAAQAVRKPSIRWPQAIERSFIHRGDYVGRHMIEARSVGDTCVRCHGQSECASCHRQRGVFAGSQRNPHPPGWVAVLGGMNLHGKAARREIVSCAACHDQGAASNCVRCHRVGGLGGNPHPPGWRSRQSRTDRMCRICHG